MGKNSRILIADSVINTTVGSSGVNSAPSPLPANYGLHTRFAHQHDLNMMAATNGIERTPAQMRSVAARSGLDLIKIWECRAELWVTELKLPA